MANFRPVGSPQQAFHSTLGPVQGRPRATPLRTLSQPELGRAFSTPQRMPAQLLQPSQDEIVAMIDDAEPQDMRQVGQRLLERQVPPGLSRSLSDIGVRQTTSLLGKRMRESEEVDESSESESQDVEMTASEPPQPADLSVFRTQKAGSLQDFLANVKARAVLSFPEEERDDLLKDLDKVCVKLGNSSAKLEGLAEILSTQGSRETRSSKRQRVELTNGHFLSVIQMKQEQSGIPPGQKGLLLYAMTGEEPGGVGGGGGSLSSLDVSDQEVTGRPTFSKLTHAYMGDMGNNNHKRHITAWHSLRDAVNKIAPNLQPGELDALLSHPQLPANIKEEACHLVLKDSRIPGYKADPGPFVQAHLQDLSRLSPEQKLKMTLYIMNTNPDNLWIGNGPDNTAINRGFKMARTALDKAHTPQALNTLIHQWSGLSGTVEKRAQALAAETLKEALYPQPEIQGGQVVQPPALSVPEAKQRAIRYLAQLEVDAFAHKALKQTGMGQQESEKAVNQSIFGDRRKPLLEAGEDLFEINELGKPATHQEILGLLSHFMAYPPDFVARTQVQPG